MLLQEPWGFSPAQIADLTPWQVEHCYLGPAAERARQAESGGKTAGEGKGHDWSDLPDRAEFVAESVAAFGKTADHWGGVWEEMKAKRDADG